MASDDLILPQFESMASIDLDWPRLILNVLKCPQMSSNGLKWPHLKFKSVWKWMFLTSSQCSQECKIMKFLNMQIFKKSFAIRRSWWKGFEFLDFTIRFLSSAKRQLVIIPSYWDDCNMKPQSFRRHITVVQKTIHTFWSEYTHSVWKSP